MTPRRLRYENPRCGRERFDARAGVDWECGPDPNDISGSKPDVRWSEYYRTSDAPRTLFSKGQWRVTSVGLELVSDLPERHERYEIRADRLLEMHDRGGVYMWPIFVASEPWAIFDDFEAAFREAIEIFHRRRSSAPITIDWWINHRLAEQRPDSEVLERTFRRAHGMRKRIGRKDIKRTLAPRLPNVEGAIWVVVERLIDAHENVWLRCQSPRGYPAILVPRPADYNDVRVLSKLIQPSFLRGTTGLKRSIAPRAGKGTIGSFWCANSQGRLEKEVQSSTRGKQSLHIAIPYVGAGTTYGATACKLSAL